MYFFYSIIIMFLIVLSSIFIYQNIDNIRNTKLDKKNKIMVLILAIETLSIIFANNITVYIFIDLACILAYSINLKREGLILSLINILYLSQNTSISWYYYLTYFIYFGISYLIYDKNKLNIYVYTKSFITGFLAFIYLDKTILNLTAIVIICLYFYVLEKIIYMNIKRDEQSTKENELIFKMAHEIKNPLSVCKGYFEMLDINNKEKLNKYLPIIKSEMNRSLTIMDDFLSLKRLNINKDIMDLNLLLEDVKQTVKFMLNNQNINIELETDEEEIILEADYDRLKQVLINLIKNSKEANASNIKMLVKYKHNIAEIKIIDDGSGLGEDVIKKIGNPFFTTKQTGTGLGVNMSMQIMKLHKGSLKYESNLKKGTTAILTLPISLII